MQNTVIPPRSFLYLQFIPYIHIKDTLGSLNNQVLSSLHNPIFGPTQKYGGWRRRNIFHYVIKQIQKLFLFFLFKKVPRLEQILPS